MMGSIHDDDAGIIPRLCRELLLELYKPQLPASPDRSQSHSAEINQTQPLRTLAEVKVGYFEVYNERIYDLLSSEGGSCRVREHPQEGAYVEGLTLQQVKSYREVEKFLMEGHSHRQVAATLMNSESSRSHAVFTIYVKQTLEMPIPGQPSTEKYKKVVVERRSKVSLIDLAGSERLNSTGATGDRLKEATNINRSLSVLGDVIRALSEQSEGEEKFIPYRNSILTWILKDSLGGNSKTTMLATISPIDNSYAESMNTLRYVERAKLIVSKAVVNDDSSNDPYIKHLQEQVSLYKGKLHTALLKIKQRESEYQSHIDRLQHDHSLVLDELKAKLAAASLRGFLNPEVPSTANGEHVQGVTITENSQVW
jgi:hypothetical protein